MEGQTDTIRSIQRVDLVKMVYIKVSEIYPAAFYMHLHKTNILLFTTF